MPRLPHPSRFPKATCPVLILVALAVLPVAAETPIAVPLEQPRPVPEPPGLEFQSAPAVALRPDGGLVAVWKHVGTGALLGRWLGPVVNGESEGEVFTIREAGGPTTGAPLVARGSDDRYLVAWVEQVPPSPSLPLHEGVFTRAFDGEGHPLGESRRVARADGFLVDLAARPGGGYVVAFRALSQAGGGIRLLLLGPDGAPSGGSKRVIEETPATPVSALSLAVDRSGTIAVSWSRLAIAEETVDVTARIFTKAEEPVGEPFVLVPAEPSVRGLEHDLAAIGQGHFLIAWAGDASTAESRPRALRVRSFDSSGGELQSYRVDAGGGSDGSSSFRSFPAVAAGPDGHAVVAWAESDTRVQPLARLVLPSGLPRGPLIELDAPHDFGEPTGVQVVRGADGIIAFGWGWNLMGLIVCPCPPDDLLRWSLVRRFQLTVGAAEPPPPPSDVPPLTTDELPGFRIWVAIGGNPAHPVYGTFEPECVPETLCVSGRVPGRSEVFVRIPGPKPNGLLWPTLVKLTTSEVEVWIEQESTGETRYYRLRGATPGFDELPGLFDRNGFEP